jgi:hypothetical protein
MKGTLLYEGNVWFVEAHEKEDGEDPVYFLRKQDYNRNPSLVEYEVVNFEVDESGLMKVAKLL